MKHTSKLFMRGRHRLELKLFPCSLYSRHHAAERLEVCKALQDGCNSLGDALAFAVQKVRWSECCCVVEVTSWCLLQFVCVESSLFYFKLQTHNLSQWWGFCRVQTTQNIILPAMKVTGSFEEVLASHLFIVRVLMAGWWALHLAVVLYAKQFWWCRNFVVWLFTLGARASLLCGCCIFSMNLCTIEEVIYFVTVAGLSLSRILNY